MHVMDQQIDLIVHWMRVGFIHGVMNTDNMAIAGETIDYGPCAFLWMHMIRTLCLVRLIKWAATPIKTNP